MLTAAGFVVVRDPEAREAFGLGASPDIDTSGSLAIFYLALCRASMYSKTTKADLLMPKPSRVFVLTKRSERLGKECEQLLSSIRG